VPNYRLSPFAFRDIREILIWTQENLGSEARRRYELLLEQAIWDVAVNSRRAGVTSRPDLGPTAFTYHLKLSALQVSPTSNRVRNPRHFLLCRVTPDGAVEIGRVLHDSMDLAEHVPPDFQ